MVTRTAIWRCSVILDRLRGGRVVRCGDLADELEVCERTVARDIAFMRDFWGVDVIGIGGAGYRFKAGPEKCPLCGVSLCGARRTRSTATV